MATVKAGFVREATEHEMKDLEARARQQLERAGLPRPSERAVQGRVKSLARARRLSLPGQRDVSSGVQSPIPERCVGLALVHAVCQQGAHEAELRAQRKGQGNCEVQGDGKIPYFFAAIPDEYIDRFARYLPPSTTLVLCILWRYAKTKMQTWVSLDTLCWKSGLSKNTVKRDLRLLMGCKILARANASGSDFHGNRIQKRKGFKYRLIMPVAWDRKAVTELR